LIFVERQMGCKYRNIIVFGNVPENKNVSENVSVEIFSLLLSFELTLN